MKTKYSIMVKDTEKEIKRIFHDLEKYGRTTFQYNDSSKQHRIATKLGRRGKELSKQGLFFPPARTRNRRHPINIVALPPGVYIKETKKNIFQFFRE